MSDWRPRASLEMRRRRAELLASIRAFFAQRGVLEVETPSLAAHGVTDVHLSSLTVAGEDASRAPHFLQTSPEYAMKRLLAAGSGPIYQIAKAFRGGERGRLHNPEFTILEWYRPGFDHHALMDEMDALLSAVADAPAAKRITYGALFSDQVGIDPHCCVIADLANASRRLGIEVAIQDLDRDGWLDLLMTHAIEPTLGRGQPTFVCDYPASQAALARVRAEGGVRVAERFEVYVEGVELANGFHELDDDAEQRRRFETDRAARQARGLPIPEVDERLLAALEAGIGNCAGVALGVDRLLMVTTGAEHIGEVLAFPIECA